MQKKNLNIIFDSIAFVSFVFLTATGVLVRYVLPPGSGHFSMLWGMDRHEWGQLHFWISVVLMASLALHLFLHWSWIVSVIKGGPTESSGFRLALAVVSVMALVGLAAAPFFGRVDQTGGESPHRMQAEKTNEGSKGGIKGGIMEGTGPRIDGSMTLGEVAKMAGVSPEIILQELGLPARIPLDATFGKLRKQYNFKMDDVREVVRQQTDKRFEEPE